jgi:predicted phosphodiesterase
VSRRVSRVAALYDIHGNVRALESVLPLVAAEAPDMIVVGGDVASGPWPRETMDILMQLPLPAVFVRGNADRDLLERSARGRSDDPADVWDERGDWAVSQMTPSQIEFLGGFAANELATIDGLGKTLFCHATPDADDITVTPVSSEERLRRHLGSADADVIVCGHTHMQIDMPAAGKRLINAGSIGMPYEGRTGAFWALVGPDVSFRHTEYDLRAAADEITGSDFPGAEEFVEEFVLSSYPRDETMQFFESQAVEREQQG